MSQLIKKDLPRILTIVVTVIITANYYISGESILRVTSDWITKGVVIITAFSQVLGVISLVIYRYKEMQQRGRWWQIRAVALLLLLIFVILGFALGVDDPTYQWIFNAIWVSLDLAGNGFIMIFVVCAAYRAFSIHSIDATVITVVTLLTALSRVPLGQVIWSGIPVMGEWVSNIPAGSVFRAIKISVALGTVMLIIRSLIGLESGYRSEAEVE